MLPFEKLDAWKACHTLTLATFKAVDDCSRLDPVLTRRLRYSSSRSGAKLAFGSGTRNKRMFRMSVARVSGYLTEFAYDLSLARVMGVIPAQVCDQLDALRGRASFYTFQLMKSLLSPPGRGERGRADG